MVRNVLLEKLILPFGDLIFNTNFVKQIKFWRKFDSYTELELQQYQELQLRKQLLYAIENLEKYKDIQVSSSESTFNLLSRFPILTKDDLKENPEKLIIKNNKKAFKIFSSGSTGKSTAVEMDKIDLISLQALSFHLYELCGFKMGAPVLQTGISPNRTFFKKLKDIFLGVLYVPVFSLGKSELNTICKKLVSKSNFVIIGYPSSINIIALHAIKNNYKIELKTVICLGDSLFEQYRSNIKRAFNCEVYETYGSSEGFQIGFQVDLDYMYQYSPQVYLELLDADGFPVKDGEIGQVVVTRLDNKHMPLIRYNVGDLAVKLPKSRYPKRRKFNFPLLEKVIGRNTDIVLLRDGRKMIVHSFTGVFEYINEIKQFRILQKNRDGIEIEYIPATNFKGSVLNEARIKLQEYIQDEKFLIIFKEVDEIKSLKSGKTQIIESLINEGHEEE